MIRPRTQPPGPGGRRSQAHPAVGGILLKSHARTARTAPFGAAAAQVCGAGKNTHLNIVLLLLASLQPR
jgi:hypothetical protein